MSPTGASISRRSFIAAATVAAAAACSSKSRQPAAHAVERPDPVAPRRVIVVGAGLAGLTAAVNLRDAGWDVLVFEARGRVGGRVHTLYGGDDGVPFEHGLRAEVGGESIDDTHTSIQNMVRRFGLSTERRPGSTTSRATKGRFRYRGQTYTFAALSALRGGAVLSDYLRVSDELQRLADKHRIDPEHPETADGAGDLDRMSFAAWLDSLKLVPEARFVAEQENVSSYNAELSDISMLFVAQQTAVTAGMSDSQVETMRITGGNATLPKAMAAALGAALIIDSPVTAVRRDGNLIGVRVRGQEHFAAHVVLAVPTPPLRDIRFDPPLPGPLAAAIAGLDLGVATKVVNQYRAAFWRSHGQSGFSMSDLTYRISWDAADSYAAPAGLLTTFTTANNGSALAALPDTARIARVRDELAIVFPESPNQLSGPAATMAWSDEPFTRGGYTVYKPNQLAAFWEPLRTGTDRIHFAGEHLEALAGYMESAVRSGTRVTAGIGPPPTHPQ
jgi:monoamine oxidase